MVHYRCITISSTVLFSSTTTFKKSQILRSTRTSTLPYNQAPSEPISQSQLLDLKLFAYNGVKERDVGGCWVQLGSLVGIARFVVGLIGDSFWTFGVWGLLEIWFWHLLGISYFEISFFFFFKLLTYCGIQNFFDYGLVWEWISWVLCWVSILWMVWFGSGFVWVFLWVFLCLPLFMFFDLVKFIFFSCGFDVHVLLFWVFSLILGLMSLLGLFLGSKKNIE